MPITIAIARGWRPVTSVQQELGDRGSVMRALLAIALCSCGPGPRPAADVDAAAGADAQCPAIHFTPTPTVPSIELLIDRSGSMATDLGGVTRYDAVREALVGAAGAVTTRTNDAYFGAALYSSDLPCPTLYTVPRARDNHAAIDALFASQTPRGSTPAAVAIDTITDDFTINPPPRGSVPVIVLATDGAPNTCDGSSGGSSQAIEAARLAHTAGIRLFVLGVGEEATTTHLQALANAGAGVVAGEPDAPYYATTEPQSLAAAFDTVITGVLTCELSIDGRIDPATAITGTVTLNGVPLVYGKDWLVIDGHTIRLLGTACATLDASPDPIVDASFPCAVVL